MTSLVEIGLSNAAMAAVVAVVAACLCRLYRRPAFAHGLWLLVLVKLLTPPLVSVPLPWFGTSERSVVAMLAGSSLEQVVLENDAAELGDPNDLAELKPVPTRMDFSDVGHDGDLEQGILPASWVEPVLAIWIAGAVLCLAWTGLCTWRFQRLLRFARAAGPEIQEQTAELAGKLGLTHAPRVWLLPGAISPMLWSLISRPRLLFPAQLLQRLDQEQLKTLLVHELAHWRRRDHWVRFLELAVHIVYWWHPAVWWARSELHEAEEQCCDAWVLRTLEGADRVYALALLETAAFISHTRLRLPATASGIGQVPHLRRRLTMIMGGQTPKSLTCAGGIALAGFGLALLPLVPVRAQDYERRTIQVQVVPAEQKKGSVDQQIEALRRVLQLLEEQKRSQAKPAPTPAANPEEVKKARSEVNELAAIVAAKRAELQKAEKRFQEAQAKLAKLAGNSATWHLRLADPGRVVRWQAGNLVVPVQPNPDKNPGVRGVITVDGLKLDALNFTPKPARPGTQDLNQRLDRLLREVEQLRREIQGARPK
jgi:bla regulator protein blaR1